MKIPNNLEECYIALDEMKIQELDKWLEKSEDSAIGESHFGLGMWLRNNWGLWAVSKTPFWEDNLPEYFNSIGIKHPDDMSGIILTSYHRHKNGKDINLEEQVKKYQTFWKNQDKRFKKPKKI